MVVKGVTYKTYHTHKDYINFINDDISDIDCGDKMYDINGEVVSVKDKGEYIEVKVEVVGRVSDDSDIENMDFGELKNIEW